MKPRCLFLVVCFLYESILLCVSADELLDPHSTVQMRPEQLHLEGPLVCVEDKAFTSLCVCTFKVPICSDYR